MKTIFTALFIACLLSLQAQVINRTVYFNSGKSELTTADKQWLDSVSPVLGSSGTYSIVVWAYCDADGSEESNVLLSQARAKAIRDVLISNKLDEKSITLNSLGESEPVADNNTEQGKAKNRRAQIAITYQSPPDVKNKQVDDPKPPVAVTNTKEEAAPEELFTGKLEVGKRLVIKNLNFEGGTAVLLEESEPALKSLLKLMKDNPTLEIEIGGHVCCGPDMPLSTLRAKKIYMYLKGYGISEKRMSYKGYSFDKPIAPENTEEGKKANRRVEITILKL